MLHLRHEDLPEEEDGEDGDDENGTLSGRGEEELAAEGVGDGKGEGSGEGKKGSSFGLPMLFFLSLLFVFLLFPFFRSTCSRRLAALVHARRHSVSFVLQ